MSNAADEKRVKEKGELEKRRADRDAADFTGIMSTESGRRFVWRMLTACHIYESSFTGNNTTFFNEGERNIGLMLMADINSHCPEMYIKMLQEAKRREENHA